MDRTFVWEDEGNEQVIKLQFHEGPSEVCGKLLLGAATLFCLFSALLHQLNSIHISCQHVQHAKLCTNCILVKDLKLIGNLSQVWHSNRENTTYKDALNWRQKFLVVVSLLLNSCPARAFSERKSCWIVAQIWLPWSPLPPLKCPPPSPRLK